MAGAALLRAALLHEAHHVPLLPQAAQGTVQAGQPVQGKIVIGYIVIGNIVIGYIVHF